MFHCRDLLAVSVLLLSVLRGGTAAGGDWTEFRGPSRQGHSDEKNLPLRWSATENVAWKVGIPGKGWSSPIVLHGRVYLTTATPAGAEEDGDQLLQAVCLDAASGQFLWTTTVKEQRAAETLPIHSKNSHASPTPLTDGKHLFVHFGTSATACLTLEGEIVWCTTDLKYDPRHGSGGSPELFEDLLVVSCDGADVQFVVALDAGTGEVRWKTARPPVPNSRKFSFTTPLVIDVAGTTQVVSPATDVVVAYEPRTGREIWRVDYDGYSVVPRPVYHGGLLYMCTGWSPPQLLAIRPDGRGNVTGSHIAWRTARSVPNTPSLLAAGREIYMVSDAGVASCLDAATGAVQWQERIGGNFSASPILADGKIYLQSEQGDTTVLRPGRKFTLLARNSLGERTLASPAVADASLFLRTEQHLYRITSRGR